MFHYSQILILIFLILFLVIFFCIGLYLPLKEGKNPFGTSGDYPKRKSIFGVLSSLILVFLVISYIIAKESVSWFYKLTLLDNEITRIIGFAFCLLSLIIGFVALLTLGKNFRIALPEEETELITKGIYGIVRHPIGGATMLYIFGIFLVIPNVFSLICFIMNVIFYNSKANAEESFLINTFGEKYLNYSKKVGKFFPKIRR